MYPPKATSPAEDSPARAALRARAESLPYLPVPPRDLRRPIGLIGAGGIAGTHLKNYRALGLNVVAIADIRPGQAEARRAEFFPGASVHTDHRELLARPDIEVVDITTHPLVRGPLIEDALRARKHVLSQKPFVLDLAEGRRLAELAEAQGVRLAVNQNGHWAPHFSYLRHAVGAGLVGEVVSVDCQALWDHTWIKSLPDFATMRHVVLYDFSIHWFDILGCFFGERRPESVFAAITVFPGQDYAPPSQASAIVSYPGAQARLGFNAHVVHGQEDSTIIAGTKGVLRTRGPGLNEQPAAELITADGAVTVPLSGSWFANGFQGTMCEFLRAIEEGREPVHSARNNLRSLELCFAALESADTGRPVRPGEVRHAVAGTRPGSA